MQGLRASIAFCVSILVIDTSAQITADYPREISCEIGFTSELPLPKVKSTCSAQIHTTQNEEMVSGGCVGTMIRKYIFADDCKNTLEVEQIIHLKDTEPPQLHDVPEDIDLKKGELIPYPARVSATDNTGDEVKVEYNESLNKNVITRTWSAVDGCNNRSVAEQKIHLEK
jgi:hypothetical protein